MNEKPLSDDVNGSRLKNTRKSISDETPREAPKSWEEFVRATEENILHLEAKLKSLSSRRKKRRTDEDEQDSSESESVDLDEEVGPTIRVSIPKLNSITWTEWTKYQGRSVPTVHHAIDVLCEESMILSAGSDLTEGKTSGTGSELQGDSVSHGKPQSRRELPERIRINSRRIQCVLDWELCEGQLEYFPGYPLHLLRPFKILDYHEVSIRERLLEFEEARQKKCPKTEEEYMALLASDPVSDEAPRTRQNAANMTVSGLTATINDLRLLVGFIDQTIKPVQVELQGNPRTIRFSELWYLFRPGSFVYVKDKNIPQAVWKVVQRTGGRRYITRPKHIARGSFDNKFSPFVLDCYYLDYNGSTFLPIYHQFEIEKFDGLQAMASLPIMPFEFAVKENLVNRESLMRRGQQFLDNIKVSHRYYSGRSQDRAPDGTKLSAEETWRRRDILIASEIIESQVMIDFEQAFKVNSAWVPDEQELRAHKMDENEFGQFLERRMDAYDQDMAWDLRVTDDFMDTEIEKWQEWKKLGSHPSGDDLLLLPDRVFAFCFRSRKWG